MDTIRINKKDVSMKSRTYKIGRGSGNDILCSDIEVSNEHAELIDNNGTFTLIDYSRNGTFVNGNRIHNTSCHVNYGDSIVFAGKERLRLHTVDWVSLKNRKTPLIVSLPWCAASPRWCCRSPLLLPLPWLSSAWHLV